MKNINKMTRKEFESLPRGKWDQEIEFDSMIILPGKAKDLHDSGYRLMDFVAVKGTKPACLLSGCSDAIHIDGIGGFGDNWLKKYGRWPDTIPVGGWSIAYVDDF